MPGLLNPEKFENVYRAWRRSLRTDPELSRIPMPDLRPFSEAFNLALAGDDEGELIARCDEFVRQQLAPGPVIRVTTMLASTFSDELGGQSGATTKSLVETLGYVCGLLSVTMVADVNELARRDPLTGLENKRAWDERLIEAAEMGAPYAVAILDLDGLKATNDNLGHDAGDDLLKRFAAELQTRVPDGTRVYRFGGDEYSIVQATGSVEALTAFLDELVAGDDVPAFSFGVAFSEVDGKSAKGLKEVADKRMYEMKRLHHTQASSGAEASDQSNQEMTDEASDGSGGSDNEKV